jgi:hypothetical protein
MYHKVATYESAQSLLEALMQHPNLQFRLVDLCSSESCEYKRWGRLIARFENDLKITYGQYINHISKIYSTTQVIEKLIHLVTKSPEAKFMAEFKAKGKGKTV